MPALRISVDGRALAVINTAGYDLLAVHVFGDVRKECCATLEAGGGTFPAHGQSTYLTWLSDVALRPGQVVTVALDAGGASSHAGQTIAELCPGEAAEAAMDYAMPAPDAAMWDALAARPRLRDACTVRYTSSAGSDVTLRTRPDEDSFSFNLLWHSDTALGTRVALGSASLASTRKREAGATHASERLDVGGAVTLAVLG